jgi:UDP-sulfoquinovose synthase
MAAGKPGGGARTLMKVFIAGIDGYLGWALAQYLAARGHDVAGMDDFSRRKWVEEVGSISAVPIEPIEARIEAAKRSYASKLQFIKGDLRNYDAVEKALAGFKPDAIVHLGQCPSAAYSMIDHAHAASVQLSNVASTLSLIYAVRAICPDAHIVKLGTMGEYGTPGLDIPEGDFEVTFRGRTAVLPFPRQAGSWYHLSKVHDSHNLAFASRVWNLAVTDLMQGVVYGAGVDGLMPMRGALATRLDFDAVFGTVVHRFCAQAATGMPLTIYGGGTQTRGFISLTDSIHCMTLTLENPAPRGEYRVFNQLSEVHSVLGIAEAVAARAKTRGLAVSVRHLPNPRVEAENHYYQPDSEKLRALGFAPSVLLPEEIDRILDACLASVDRINSARHAMEPRIRWN